MWLVFGLALAETARLPWDCGPNTGCVCQHNGRYDVVSHSYDDCLELSSWDGCIFCSKTQGCENVTNPASGLYCWPNTKTCSMCASPTQEGIRNLLGPGYTIYLRRRCTTTSKCPADYHKPLPFASNMTVDGGTGKALTIDGEGLTLMGPCPMFVFSDIDSLTLRNMTIDCTSTTLRETAPAILIRGIIKSAITVSNVTTRGYVKSAVLVLGGQFNTLIPTLHADLGGSSFSGIVISTTRYRLSMELALALYYGTIDVSGMSRVTTQMIVQPALNPATGFVTPLTGATGLTIFNMSEWTRLFGIDYEIIANDPHGTLGFSLIESDEFNALVFRIGLTALAGLFILIIIRFWGPVMYLRKLAKAS